MILATLCFLRQKGKTLMIHRIKKNTDLHLGKWNGLGGKIEQGETPEECVIREVMEESGLLIKNPRLHGFITFPMFDGIQDWNVFVFTAVKFQGNLRESGEGFLKWIPNNDIPKLNLWEGDRIFLPWLERNEFFSARFVYEEGRLKNHNVTFYR